MPDADLIIIGAGPAGMAAASTAARGGLRVLLLDEQPRAGGQIYRDVASNADRRGYLGKDYLAGRAFVDALDMASITQEFGASVWRIEPGSRVVWSRDGVSRVSPARHVLLAGGAQERPTPFPGWTLPGVMSAGAAQILMKNAGLLPREAVLAGSGPLLYLVAAQMIEAGATPKALVETQTLRNLVGAARHLPRAFLAAPTLIKGLGLIRKIQRAGVPRFTGAMGLRATQNPSGDLSFTFRSGSTSHTLVTPLLLTHQGVVPSTHMSRASGVPHVWNDIQKAYQPVTDQWGGTDVPGLHIAGDGAGIGGADAANAAGQLAALDILYRLGQLSEDRRDQNAARPRGALRQALAIRPFLDAAYGPSPDLSNPAGDTIVCRCEEITAEAIRAAHRSGAQGPRQIKTATRAGMGPCQGRMCDLTVRGILASCGAEVSPPRARTPIKPVKLGELAALAPEQKT
ncbi:FAD-dependent oxidoreductase [Primorskyibacter sp. S187A]|uniref:FAD-dependent oxidoreductase n=1 Tax=Primorskyibacter sp. S187A TaxID=3415130 RepID=UPI003C7E3A11